MNQKTIMLVLAAVVVMAAGVWWMTREQDATRTEEESVNGETKAENRGRTTEDRNQIPTPDSGLRTPDLGNRDRRNISGTRGKETEVRSQESGDGRRRTEGGAVRGERGGVDGTTWRQAEMVVARVGNGAGAVELTPNQVGTLVPRVEMTQNRTVPVSIAYPNGSVGERVIVAVEDGGQLSEAGSGGKRGAQRVMSLSLDDQRTVNFDFTATGGPGMFRVTVRKGGDVKRVELWAN